MEIAFTVADMIAYFDAAVARGVNIVAATRNSYFFLGAQIDFLEEVAKFRAARRIFARIMKERYHIDDEEAQKLKIFAYTNGSALTAEQPLNNIIRVTIETMAAIAGGIQTLATSSYDEAFSLPTQEAVTVSLRTQQIVGYESGITNTVDALGGSYAVECLTDKIEAEIYEYLDKIEKMGGAVKCIEQGYFQRELAEASYRYQKKVDAGERVVVGLTRFKDDKAGETPRVARQRPRRTCARCDREGRRRRRKSRRLHDRGGGGLYDAGRDLRRVGEGLRPLYADENLLIYGKGERWCEF